MIDMYMVYLIHKLWNFFMRHNLLSRATNFTRENAFSLNDRVI
jgi:hypothetical protein